MVPPVATKRSSIELPLPDLRDPCASDSVSSRQAKSEFSEAVRLDGNNNSRATKANPEEYYAKEEDDSSSYDDTEALVTNPSVDIQDDLETALSLDFSSTFACAQSYPDAPNPCLSIDGFGALGLPLNEREAKTLISVCQQASRGKSERTVIDKDVHNIWELSADKVHFQNPEWQQFLLTKVVPNVCVKLGAYYRFAPPRCDLYKLSVYEQGSSCFLPHQDAGKTDGTFATVIIVLPSKYSGAALHLSHSGATNAFDLSETSGTVISALAWYTDVLHEVEPLVNGYVLALTYNLVHIPNHLYPSLPVAHDATSKLRHVLTSWKQSAIDKAPKKLACILDHKYLYPTPLRGDTLMDEDADLLSHIEPIARQLHFRLYLANLELHVSGVGNVSNKYGDCNDSDCMECDGGRDDVSMIEVNEQHITVQTVVDLDGMPCELDVDFDQDTEMIHGSLDDEEPDEREYEGYQYARGHGSLDYWYRRTVLLIWPENRDLKVTVGDVVNFAIDEMNASTTNSASQKQRKLVGHLLQSCKARWRRCQVDSQLSRAAQILCATAERWKDPALWIQGARACGVDQRIDVLGVEWFISGIQTFGFEPLRELLTDAVKNGVSNTRRSQLVDGIFSSVQDRVAREWCLKQRAVIMHSLTCPTEAEVPLLIIMARTNGIPFVRSVLIPQIQRLQAHPSSVLVPSTRQPLPELTKFWIAFLTQLHMAKDAIPPKADDVDSLISELLVAVLDKVDPLAKTLNQYLTRHVYHHEQATTLVLLCVATDNVSSCSIIFNKIISATAAGTMDIQNSLANEFYLPVVRSLDQSLRPVTLRSQPFSPFFRSGAESILTHVVGTPLFSAVQMQTLLTAFKWGCDVTWLKQWLIPLLRRHNYTLARDFAVAIHAQRKTLFAGTEATASVHDIIKELVDTAIHRADLKTVIVGYRGELPACAKVALELIKLCYDTQHPILCEAILVALVGALEPEEQWPTRLSNVVLPVIPVLRQYLSTIGLDFTDEPYRGFIIVALLRFVVAVVGAKPAACALSPQELQSFGCGCFDCNAVKQFFFGPSRTTTIRRAQPYRTHLERELVKKRNFGATWTTLRHGSPHGLQITKSESLTALGDWMERRTNGVNALKSIGDESVQRRILGEKYEKVINILQGNVVSIFPGKVGDTRKFHPAATASSRADTMRSGSQGTRMPLADVPVASMSNSASSKRPLPDVALGSASSAQSAKKARGHPER